MIKTNEEKIKNIGIVTQVIGAVVDVHFEDELPSIYNALKLKIDDNKEITLEVMQHIGERTVRCIAMSSTDGIARGMEVINTNAPITVPVGRATLGRVLNVTGDPVDNYEPVKTDSYLPIHRDSPAFAVQ